MPTKLNGLHPQDWDESTPTTYVDPFDIFQKGFTSEKNPPTGDAVDHPPHYNNNKIECIHYLEDSLGDGFTYYLEGNVKKYLHRWYYKTATVEDLRKARWYLEKLIETAVKK
jgi:hypothetical protein